MNLCQVAYSVLDGRKSARFYRDCLGFVPSGGTSLFKGPLYTRIQGLPKVASSCRWLVDSEEFFQLELFEFSRPTPRPMRPDWQPSDIGYSRVQMRVGELERTLKRLAEAGHPTLGGPLEIEGRLHACVRDPDGVLLELSQAMPGELPDSPQVAVTGVGLSVPDLDRSRRFFVDTIGLREGKPQPEREQLWGLKVKQPNTLCLEIGGKRIELSQYEGARPRRTDYQLSDQGLLNIALGFRRKKDLDRVFRRVVDAGYKPNSKPVHFGFCSVVYLNDDQGFSVELLHAMPVGDRFIGFKPPPKWLPAL